MEQEEKGKILDQVKEKVTVVTEKITEVKETFLDDEIISEYKLMGSEAAEKILSQINESNDLIIRSGYLIKSVSVGLGVPPSVKLTFKYSKEISEAEEDALLKETEGRKILSIILKALFKSNDLYNKIKVGKFKMDTVGIGIGLIPDISIILTSE